MTGVWNSTGVEAHCMSEELWGSQRRSVTTIPEHLHRAFCVANGLILLPAFNSTIPINILKLNYQKTSCAGSLSSSTSFRCQNGEAGRQPPSHALVGALLIDGSSSHNGDECAGTGDCQPQCRSAAHCLGEWDWRRRRIQSLATRAELPSLHLPP